MMDSLLHMDGNILLFIQDNIRNPVLDPVMKVITSLGNGGIIWILLTILLLAFRRTRKIGIMSACALVCSLLVNNILLKNLVARARPYITVDGLTPIIAKPSEFSFPSGHAGSSFASGSVLYRRLPKKHGIPILILAILISFSRLYVGVHYPTDVLAGMLTGIGCSYAGEWTMRKKRRTNRQIIEQLNKGL